MSGGISNMFRESLVDKLNRRLSMPTDLIRGCLSFMVGVEHIPFLRNKIVSSQQVVLSLNRSAFK